MNEFISVLENYKKIEGDKKFKRGKLTTLQVNIGDLCNQSCSHCHVDASPNGKNSMSIKVVEDIVRFCKKNPGLILDITGGAPELNPNFKYLIKSSCSYVSEILVRSNLTVLSEPGLECLPKFYKDNNVHLICSLPCYTKDTVDKQRGKGVFDKSVTSLKNLNEIGFGENLSLDLVYNPGGPFLPSSQECLEKDYKQKLSDNYDIKFNRLITITNVPIKRFKAYLDSNGGYEQYLHLLKENFNPSTVENLMCRTFLSVGYDGKLYDCDFNQALSWALKDRSGEYLEIGNLKMEDLENMEILVGEHCFSCTAGAGSSCQGVISEDSDSTTNQREQVKEYYGAELQGTNDLKTSACCISDSMPKQHKEILKSIDSEIIEKIYGCGSPIPSEIQGSTILDLGCGTGRDVYIASKLVGEKGKVIGLDMTDSQLEVAKKHISSQADKFGYSKPNVIFKKGYIEDLKAIDIPDNTVDVVISNCVINLSIDKRKVFSEIYRVLKEGGELYFADIFADRRVPVPLKKDPVLYGECLAGALYIEDFRRILRDSGFLDYRIVLRRKVGIENDEIKKKVGPITFYSMTVRTFKLSSLEDACEDYGQTVSYKGTIANMPDCFVLDKDHIFTTGSSVAVCGNTASMVSLTRYRNHFSLSGDRKMHYGLFKNCLGQIKEEDAIKTGSCC
ncbi:arsenosugar biosynthesis radical SAM (seleno)protein ArsS [Chlamydiota bacterium]